MSYPNVIRIVILNIKNKNKYCKDIFYILQLFFIERGKYPFHKVQVHKVFHNVQVLSPFSISCHCRYIIKFHTKLFFSVEWLDNFFVVLKLIIQIWTWTLIIFEIRCAMQIMQICCIFDWINLLRSCLSL